MSSRRGSGRGESRRRSSVALISFLCPLFHGRSEGLHAILIEGIPNQFHPLQCPFRGDLDRNHIETTVSFPFPLRKIELGGLDDLPLLGEVDGGHLRLGGARRQFVRGQRTRTNARTKRGARKPVAGKRRAVAKK